MDDRVNAMVCEYGRDLCIVADVALHETMPRVAGNRIEVLEIAGICELVERCDLDIRAARQRIADEGRSDEPGTAGDKKLHEQFSVKCYGFRRRVRTHLPRRGQFTSVFITARVSAAASTSVLAPWSEWP